MKHALLFALLALASCTSVVALPPGPAALGKFTAVEGLQVRPLAVLEDSRCPASVQCVWAGQVRIRAEIFSRSGREFREMTLGQPIAVSGGRLTLAAVEPPKAKPGATKAGEYSFSFHFER